MKGTKPLKTLPDPSTKDLIMTDSQPRSTAQPASLQGLVVDNTLRPVVDEFSALRLYKPSLVDYAAFARNPPSLVAMAARAHHHADETARFVAMVQDNDRDTFMRHVGQLVAVAMLNNIATIAIALLPARTAADRHAKREQGYAFLGTLDDPGDGQLRELGEIAFGLRGVDAAEIAADAIAFAAIGRMPAKPDRATMHTLEEQAALRSWLGRTTDPDMFRDHADRHGAMAIRFIEALERDDLGPAEHEGMAAAHEGAVLQRDLALAALACCPQVKNARALLESARGALTARPQAAAGLELALAIGEHLRKLAAAKLC